MCDLRYDVYRMFTVFSNWTSEWRAHLGRRFPVMPYVAKVDMESRDVAVICELHTLARLEVAPSRLRGKYGCRTIIARTPMLETASLRLFCLRRRQVIADCPARSINMLEAGDF